MQTILHLLSYSYLFNKSPAPFALIFVWYFIGFLGLLMLISLFVLKSAKKRDLFAKKSGTKFLVCVWTMGIIGIFLVLARQINAIYLSAPIILLIWLVVFAIWVIKIAHYKFIIAPRRRKDLMQDSGKRTYIP